MKARVWFALILIALLLVAVPLSQAWAGGGGRGGWGRGGPGNFHGRVFIGTSFWWPGPYYYPYYYPYPYAYPYAYAPAPVIVEQPVYTQRAEPAPESYWYYCQSAQGYYPTVSSCQEAWIKVPPRSE